MAPQHHKGQTANALQISNILVLVFVVWMTYAHEMLPKFKIVKYLKNIQFYSF